MVMVSQPGREATTNGVIVGSLWAASEIYGMTLNRSERRRVMHSNQCSLAVKRGSA